MKQSRWKFLFFFYGRRILSCSHRETNEHEILRDRLSDPLYVLHHTETEEDTLNWSLYRDCIKRRFICV